MTTTRVWQVWILAAVLCLLLAPGAVGASERTVARFKAWTVTAGVEPDGTRFYSAGTRSAVNENSHLMVRLELGDDQYNCRPLFHYAIMIEGDDTTPTSFDGTTTVDVRVDENPKRTLRAVLANYRIGRLTFMNGAVAFLGVGLLEELEHGRVIRVRTVGVDGAAQFDRFSLLGVRASVGEAYRLCTVAKRSGRHTVGTDRSYFD